MSESQIGASCVERFLRYVTIDTQSDENSETFPSTLKQLDLLKHLVDELKAIGLKDAALDEHGYVMATLPPNVPEAVMMSLPICSPSAGFSENRMTAAGSSGRTMSCPR